MTPSTYQHWQTIFHRELIRLGMVCQSDEAMRRCARTVWYQRHRLRRIEKRLRAEADAFTDSYAQAIVDMVFRKERPS